MPRVCSAFDFSHTGESLIVGTVMSNTERFRLFSAQYKKETQSDSTDLKIIDFHYLCKGQRRQENNKATIFDKHKHFFGLISLKVTNR